ncbi:neurotensin/neuromedin N [Lampris incognitus]|uniref:neurotensin/neuromedin N n=1 Tax=Lampris incognitus TaxID=2546036 RepID=UPI0024B5F175|nr:neurotensin/neuromedin N [Lampris incognitus]
MQAQFACVLLLCLICGGLCTDVDQEQRALEDELLSSLFSKMKQNRQSAPYWPLSLANLCKVMNSLKQPWQKPWSNEEEEEEEELREGRTRPLEELFILQDICQGQQTREERLLRQSLGYLEGEQVGDTPLKRKSPYILKRQAAHTTKSRRPYILKRSTFY